MSHATEWLCVMGCFRIGVATTRLGAMRLCEKPYWHGFAVLSNSRTGETWERRAGSWILTIPARRRQGAA